MKWIIILLLAAAGVWVYYHVDFSDFKGNANQTIKQEKTIKKFFAADEANKQETQDVLNNY